MDISKQDLIVKIEHTMRSVENAKRSCGNAGLAETVDLFSKSKLVSAWSSVNNYVMSDDLNRMKADLKSLQLDLHDFQAAQNIHAPNDLLDLAADYFLDWQVDWLSWLNMNRTYEIQRQCDDIHRKLGQILNQLKQD